MACRWVAGRDGRHAAGLQLARQLTFDGTVQGAAISPDGSWLAYVTIECPRETDRCTSALQVREVDGTQSVRLLSWPVLAPDLKWSPDGATVLFRGAPDSGLGATYLINRLGGSVRRLDRRATAMDFTPDGHQVALAAGPAGRQLLLRYDVASLALADSIALPTGLELRDLEFARDGDRLAFVAEVRGAYLALGLLGPDGRMSDSTQAPARPLVRWTSDGSALLYFQPGPGIADDLMRLPVHGDQFNTKGTDIVLGQVPTGYEGRLDAARNGRVALITASTFHTLSVSRLDLSQRTWVPIATRTGFVATPAISPDGSRIAATATDNLGDNLYVFPVDGGQPHAATALHDGGEDARWSPDGQHLAYWNHKPQGLGLIDVAGGRPRIVIPNFDLPGGLHDWIGNDALVFYRGGALELVDTLGARRGVLRLPDSLGELVAPLLANPITSQVAYWSRAAGRLVVADLRARQFVSLSRSADRLVPLGWGPDSSLFAGTTSANPFIPSGTLIRRIVRIPSAGAKPSLVLSVPVACSRAVVGAGGRLAVCAGDEIRPDVWLADEAGRSGW